ncbi:MAG TPA: hybrid sensor histidine kinase/response regulator [Limnobacter sp.]|uniref:ATP-binding response regulator n=1 Tax=Limnobacter sp. TaxID=2003368 RepID=UPI002EDB1AC7
MNTVPSDDTAYAADIRREQCRLLFDHLPFVLIGSLVSATGVGAIFWNLRPHGMVLGWVAAIYLLCGIRWWIRRRFRSIGSTFEPDRWIRIATVQTFTAGCLWGSMGILFFGNEPIAMMTLVIVLGGMTAGAVSSHSCHVPAYAAYAIPTVVPFALRCLVEGSQFHAVVATLSLTFLLVNINYGKNLQRMLLETLELRFRNADLVKALRHQKDVAERASLAKTRFLAAASHDLRQPVQAIELFVDVLSQELQNRPQASMLGRIRAAGRGLESLLNALLDFSRIDAASITPDVHSFPLQPLLDSLKNTFAAQAEVKGLELHIQPTRLLVRSDPNLLERILRNFVANALKYTPAGRVVVGCRRRGSELRIDVIDTGIGIPESAHQQVFNEFFQLDNPERDREKGLGLGLFIANGLADLLGHRIAIDSRVGHGARFSIHVEQGRLADLRANESALADHGLALQGKAILIIDDDPDIRTGLAEMLERWECATTTAESAEEALELIQISGFMPDAILADYRLRLDATGTQAIADIRARWGPIPAAILTGDTDPDRIREARASGLPLLHKPLSAAKLRAALSHLLQDKPA